MRRIKEDEALRRILEATVSQTGFAFLRELVRNLAQTLHTRAAWVTRYVPEKRRLSSLAFWRDGSFVDSYDYDKYDVSVQKASQEHHLNELEAIESQLHERSIVLIDDCRQPGGGKGKLVIEHMLTKGWKALMSEYQVLLVRDGAGSSIGRNALKYNADN